MIAHVMDDLENHTLQVGDRLELQVGNRFGRVVEIRAPEVFVQMEGGGKLWINLAQSWYAPAPHEMLARELAIRQGWSQTTLMNRKGLDLESEPVTVTLVHEDWDASLLEYVEVI